MEKISSRQNATVKRFRDLVRSAADGSMLLDGAHLVEEALASDLPLEVVAIGERQADRFAPLAERAREAGAKTYIVTDSVLAALSPVEQPSGIVAIAARPGVTIEAVFEREPQLVLLVADVQDPGNVGAIIRAAEACGATGVAVGDGSADPFGWKALRGSMGSSFRLPVAPRQPLDQAIARARRQGIRVAATVPRGGTPLPDCDLRGATAILLGGEGPGLTPELVRAADLHITIPMTPPVESLNVATAAALVLYEASRQRAREQVNDVTV